MHVVWLGEPASLDASTVGGKTANLGRLATSFRVPPGFCLDAATFDELRSALDADARARGLLRELVAASYADLARRVGEPEPRVAVRSSAIGEDAADASFAGQHETILDVGGVDAIVDALLLCWRSVESERAITYRKQRGIATKPRIAVLVQLMVPADASAIAFSADPVSGARDVVVVNAARGLGDAIASGAITPDSYTVRKHDLAIASRSTADGGAVADADVAAIARLAMQLETVMGSAVDIECALRDGALHLLQCRPITTLRDEFPVTWADPKDAKRTWMREDSHMDRVLGPLAIEFVLNGPDHGIQRRGADVNSPMILRHHAFNGRFYVTLEPRDPTVSMPEALTAATALRRGLARTLRPKWDGEILPEVLAHYDWMRHVDFERVSRADAAETWLEFWRRVNRIWTLHFVVTGSAYPVMEELAQTYERLLGGNGGEALAMTQGLAPTLQRLERDLHELAVDARRSPEIAAAIDRGERDPSALAALPGGDRFTRALNEFLAVHGDIGQETLDLASAPWRDEPAKLIGVIAQRGSDREHPDARHARVRAAADEIAGAARARLADRPDDHARFEEVLAAATSAGPLSEEHNYWIDRISQAHARRISLAAGARLVREGVLGSANEIFFLYVPEIADALRDPMPLADLMATRARELRRWRELRAPKTIGAPPEAPPPLTPGASAERTDFEHAVAQDEGSDVLRGVAASRGVATGPARIVTDEPDFAKMRAGDVLVCRQSTVSWAPLYTMAAAVVTEIGGALCHAAVIAREFGVPCVVATGTALSTLTDGEPLEVDGNIGRVRRLFPITWTDPDDANIVWRRDDAHQTAVRTPLAIDYSMHGASYGMRKRDESLGPPVLNRFGAFNGRMYVGSKPLRPPDEMARHQIEATGRRRRLARRIRADWDERYLPELNEIYAWMRDLEPGAMTREAAVVAWEDLWRRHRRAWTIHMLVTAASYTVTDELGQTYEELVGGPAAEAFALIQGLAPTLQRFERDVAEITEAARRAPAVAAAVARGTSLDELRSLDPAYARALDAFLSRHGDSGQSTEGLGAPSWDDDPSLLIGAIAGRLAGAGEDPDARLARLRANADAIARRARDRLANRPADLARFDEVLAAARSAGPLTEEHNYWLDRRNQAHMGRAVMRFGRRLVREGALATADEILLLYLPEVREALRSPRDLSALIAARVDEQRRWKEMRPPETIGAPAPAWAPGSATRFGAPGHLVYRERQRDPSHTLLGVGASAGLARGPARLIRDASEFSRFKRGDVLVCQASNVSWIPLFTAAAAVVTEVGGALSHAAVVAREFGVPCVVGTAVALTALRDGEMLEVDGTAGTVRRLEA